MSDTVPTVVVKGQDGKPLIKNLSDYDATKHELYSAPAKPAKPAKVSKADEAETPEEVSA